ncbi:hypothetical protein HS088_TW07G00465 [Tripterygium wilfordii]|uniref:Uncharacterized protein n=1 Tax=Tripterygium wilfordii TaxID=458696 RepID=A0A7J7DF12_TRIWF|nr:hypothetical protein HS088_TW07G00465 [Tripterygium wilfordii]
MEGIKREEEVEEEETEVEVEAEAETEEEMEAFWKVLSFRDGSCSARAARIPKDSGWGKFLLWWRRKGEGEETGVRWLRCSAWEETEKSGLKNMSSSLSSLKSWLIVLEVEGYSEGGACVKAPRKRSEDGDWRWRKRVRPLESMLWWSGPIRVKRTRRPCPPREERTE